MNPNDPAIQFNTRISLRQRENLDKFLEYMQKPLRDRPEETEDWPDTITAVVDEALSTFFAEHPMRPRKGPKNPTPRQIANVAPNHPKAKSPTTSTPGTPQET